MNIQKSKPHVPLSFIVQPKNLLRVCICLVLCTWAVVHAQFVYTFVTNTNAVDATAFNNSHKIALRDAGPNTDTISIVFHEGDSIKYAMSTNRGLVWQTPITISPGNYPGIDVDAFGYRHIVWQQTDSLTGTTDIMYDCLDDYGMPVNISESAENSMFADVVVDDSMNAYIIWVENIDNSNQILYRPCHAGSLGTIFQVSPTWPHATHTLPSISIYEPDFRVFVLWDCIDTSCYSPYQILYCYKQDSVWSSVTTLYASHMEAGHSSLDYDHGNDPFSGCYDYTSTTNNREITFYAGNGGGYATLGVSTYPVMTTMGDVWSYLFWQEDSAGLKDIYYQLYYFITGWTNGSIRTDFPITESVRFPSSCGAYLVWTQGDASPYSIYFADFGYPVSTEEHNDQKEDLSFTVAPNPFQKETRITYDVERNAQQLHIEIYDISGQSVKIFPRRMHNALRSTLVWDGMDNTGKEVPAGIYLVVMSTPHHHAVQKIIKLK
ncbi:T9SS type A sorting domain-containing protein [candidate division WOR-3 bacterium]|nr:T9SS type A sorting domain-containing protein [candidate division WOR-3 bacterium]